MLCFQRMHTVSRLWWWCISSIDNFFYLHFHFIAIPWHWWTSDYSTINFSTLLHHVSRESGCELYWLLLVSRFHYYYFFCEFSVACDIHFTNDAPSLTHPTHTYTNTYTLHIQWLSSLWIPFLNWYLLWFKRQYSVWMILLNSTSILLPNILLFFLKFTFLFPSAFETSDFVRSHQKHQKNWMKKSWEDIMFIWNEKKKWKCYSWSIVLYTLYFKKLSI